MAKKPYKRRANEQAIERMQTRIDQAQTFAPTYCVRGLPGCRVRLAPGKKVCTFCGAMQDRGEAA
jgi:hypothetical protein